MCLFVFGVCFVFVFLLLFLMATIAIDIIANNCPWSYSFLHHWASKMPSAVLQVIDRCTTNVREKERKLSCVSNSVLRGVQVYRA